MSEFSFIDWIRQRVIDRPPVRLGIGDDAAILEPSARPLLVTTDMLMEGTDFTFPETTPELAGRKSLAVNLSDIAAMAGVPTAAFVSVALPKSPRYKSLFPRGGEGGRRPDEGVEGGRGSERDSASEERSPAHSPTEGLLFDQQIASTVKRSPPHPNPLPHGGEGTKPGDPRAFAEAFFTGLIDLADEFGVIIAGGDTNTWDGPLVANITLLGHPAGKAAVTRGGAKPGDLIFVTGELGGSIHGHHLTFTPRIREAQQLIELVDIHAMIDISDGLAADLHHILDASNVGAVIEAAKIPLRLPSGGRQPPECGDDRDGGHNQGANAPRSEIKAALSDGEDFELLFTVSPSDAEKLELHWPGPTRLTCLGEITADRACWLIDGDQTISLPPLGWVHSL